MGLVWVLEIKFGFFIGVVNILFIDYVFVYMYCYFFSFEIIFVGDFFVMSVYFLCDFVVISIVLVVKDWIRESYIKCIFL